MVLESVKDISKDQLLSSCCFQAILWHNAIPPFPLYEINE